MIYTSWIYNQKKILPNKNEIIASLKKMFKKKFRKNFFFYTTAVLYFKICIHIDIEHIYDW